MGRFLLLVATITFSLTAAANEVPVFETVVEDLIFNTTSRVIIDEETIKDSRAPNITSLLQTQAGLTISNTPFQPNSIYIRGGDASHVLILVDGVPFYDASTVQRTVNLNSLDIKAVKRIEILKGSQTVLYGGQAMSGVIKIETIPDRFSPGSQAQVQVGTQAHKDITISHTEPITENSGVLFRGQGSWKDMESPVLGSSKTYPRNNINGEAAYAWRGASEGYIKGAYLDDYNRSVTSGSDFRIVDADNFEQYNRQSTFTALLNMKTQPWQPKLSAGLQKSLRTYDFPVGPVNPTLTDEDYESALRTVRLDLQPLDSEKVRINAGLSYVYEAFVLRDKSVETKDVFSEQRGLFVKADYTPTANFEFILGGRIESWADRDPAGTYQVGVVLFEDTKLEVASGYKVPSLFQFYSKYGNPDLKEERSLQYTLSQEFEITDKQMLSVTLFSSEIRDLIVAQAPTYKNANIGKTETKGVEVYYTLSTDHSSQWSFSYMYQEPRDVESDSWLIRRPLVNGSLRYMKRWENQNIRLELMGVGERRDRAGMASYTTIPGYAIANAAYSREFSKDITGYLRLNNLADYRYQDSYSYYSEGFSAIAGAAVNF